MSPEMRVAFDGMQFAKTLPKQVDERPLLNLSKAKSPRVRSELTVPKVI